MTGRLARRLRLVEAIARLPDGHGPVTCRIDSACYAVELLHPLRKEQARFTVSVPRSEAMRNALARMPDTTACSPSWV